MNRRNVLKLGALGGLDGVLSRSPAILRKRYCWGMSSQTTPFVTPLPFPPWLQRVEGKERQMLQQSLSPLVEQKAREIVDPDMQTLVDLNQGKFFKINIEQVCVSLHPELPPTPVWRYGDGSELAQPNTTPIGPSFRVKMNAPQVIRFFNDLPRDHVGFGMTNTTVHFHGGHVQPIFDGFPENVDDLESPVVFSPGHSFDALFPMLDVGATEGLEHRDPDERPSMLWYHDHLIDFTGPNVYRGLAAAFLIHDDDYDRNDERSGLRLPSRGFDIPLVLSDKRIASDGTLVYLPEDFDGFLGDKFCVNGVINPYLDVLDRKYRFRILNGSNARFYLLSVTDNAGDRQSFDVIANEGGLLHRTLRDQHSMFIANAESREFVIDFSKYPDGTELYLTDFLDQSSGRGPGGDFEDPDQVDPGDANRIMKFIVNRRRSGDRDFSRVPDVLRPIRPVPQAKLDAAVHRHIEFHRSGGAWAINDRFVDLSRPLFTVQRGQPEIWTLENGGGGWWHPIHVHISNMRVLERNGHRPGPLERDGNAKKNTINLAGGDVVKVFVEFRDYCGSTVFHCHNLEHEDHFMMARFDIAP